MATTQSHENGTQDLTNTTTAHQDEYYNGHGETVNVFLKFNNVWGPFITILGVIGNIIAFTIFSRAKFSDLSFSVYTRTLAVADTVVVCITYNFIWAFKEMLMYINHNDWACKLWGYLYLSVPWISSWILVCITVERLIVIQFPLKAKMFCTKKNAIIASCSLCFIFLAGNIHVIFKYYTKSGVCVRTDYGSELYGYIMFILSLILYSSLPALIIIVCNVLIIYALVKAARVRRSATASNAPASSSSNNIIIMLLVNSMAFVVLTTPVNVAILVDYIYPELYRQDVFYVSDVLADLNHAINFFLYAVIGTQFRKEMLSFFCPKKCVNTGGRSFLQDDPRGRRSNVNLQKTTTLSTVVSE